MSSSAFDGLLERIYEVSVVPELWPSLIEDLSQRTEAAFGSLLAISNGDVATMKFIGTEPALAVIGDYMALGIPDLNSRIRLGTPLVARGDFITDFDIQTAEQIAEDPFYKDFLHPRGFGWFCATGYDLPSGDSLLFSIERHRERGPFEPAFVDFLNAVRPHLGRAALLSARLSFERARAMTASLDAIGIPAAVLRQGGAVSVANASFAGLVPAVLQDRRGRLTATHRPADALLATAIEAVAGPLSSDHVQSIPIPAGADHPPLVLHVVPVRGAAHDVFARASAIVAITPVDRAKVATAEVIQALFDLTPAEGRVARLIAQGRTIAEIARGSGQSAHTVRAHVKSVLGKTGTGRQAGLAALLAGTSLPKTQD